jgi:hypothetical protein
MSVATLYICVLLGAYILSRVVALRGELRLPAASRARSLSKMTISENIVVPDNPIDELIKIIFGALPEAMVRSLLADRFASLAP